MKKVISLLLGLVVAAAALAQSKVVTESIRSEFLGCEQKFNVYLPAGYDAARCYPVIYLLHGLYGEYHDWQTQGNMQTVADELIASGELLPVVIVMPNAGNPDIHHYQNGYFNVENWPYENFFFQEFLPAVEKQYNCGGRKGARAIMGLSMGGGGATVYAQRHPDLFSSCYAMSAWLDNDDSHPVKMNAKKKDKRYYAAKSVREHSALDFIDQADEATIASLRTVKWFIDCGDDDFVLEHSFQLHMKMKAAKVKSELRVRNGVHNWEYWHNALRQALPFASRSFDK